MELGEQIAAARRAKGWSQTRLAEELEVSLDNCSGIAGVIGIIGGSGIIRGVRIIGCIWIVLWIFDILFRCFDFFLFRSAAGKKHRSYRQR